MSTEQNKAIASRLQTELFQNADLTVADELIDADFINHAAPRSGERGPASAKNTVNFLHDGLADIRYQIEEMLAEGDLVAFRCVFSGTHARTFLGQPPTGVRVVVNQQHILRFRDGKVAEHWAVRDDLAMVRQLGLGPAADS